MKAAPGNQIWSVVRGGGGWNSCKQITELVESVAPKWKQGALSCDNNESTLAAYPPTGSHIEMASLQLAVNTH